MHWNPGVYGAQAAEILALAENGERLMPLAEGSCCPAEARRHPGSERERAALEIQRAEWQLLFDDCAQRSSR